MNKECPLMHENFCLKRKCAWYLVHSGQCAIPLIASELRKTRLMETKWMTEDVPKATRQVTEDDSL